MSLDKLPLPGVEESTGRNRQCVYRPARPRRTRVGVCDMIITCYQVRIGNAFSIRQRLCAPRVLNSDRVIFRDEACFITSAHKSNFRRIDTVVKHIQRIRLKSCCILLGDCLTRVQKYGKLGIKGHALVPKVKHLVGDKIARVGQVEPALVGETCAPAIFLRQRFKQAAIHRWVSAGGQQQCGESRVEFGRQQSSIEAVDAWNAPRPAVN